MTPTKSIRRLFRATLAAALLTLGLSQGEAKADHVTVTDIAGRTVQVTKNPSRIILGEGRMIYSLAVLDRENPFRRIVGWNDDLIKYDPDAYRKYLAKFPEAASIANLGSPSPANTASKK